MTRIASWMDHYYDTIYPELHGLESMRLGILSSLKTKAIVIAFCMLGVAWLLIELVHFTFVEAAGLSLSLGAMAWMFLYQHARTGYDTLFKSTVIEKIIAHVDPSLRYTPMAFIDPSLFQRSHLFPQTFDRFSGSDLVEGHFRGAAIRFSHIHVEEKRRNHKDQEEWHTIFQGLFVAINAPKPIHGSTYLFPDHAQRFLGDIGQWFQSLSRTHGALVRMDHPEFERHFVIYSDDQIEARYLLPPAQMERIVRLYTAYQNPLFIAFTPQALFIAIATPTPLFTPKLRRSVQEFKHIQPYIEHLEMIIEILELFIAYSKHGVSHESA